MTATEDSARSKGFWMESLAPDGDPATSEGIYVAWEGAFTLHAGRPGAESAGESRRWPCRPTALPVTTLRLVALEPLPAVRDASCRRRCGSSPSAGSRGRSTTTA